MWNLKKIFALKIFTFGNHKFFKDSRIRNLRGFFKIIILPYFVKVFLATLGLLIIAFFGLKILKPNILDKIYKKASYRFFLYLDLDNYGFSSINITGARKVDKDEIIKIVNKVSSKSDKKSLIKNISIAIKKSQPWVEKVNIFRTLPNRLNIAITEYVPFAIWQKNGNKYIIDRQGNKVEIDNDDEFDYLLILSGSKANLNAKSLFNLLAANPEVSSKVYFASWVGNRRWNLRFESGFLVKLPSSGLQQAWRNLIKIYNSKGAIENLKVMDLRFEDKTYLEYKSKK